MKNRFFSAFCLVFMCLAIAGCSQGEDINETTVSIDNKGVITHSIIESFDKDYYNEDELRSIISDEVEKRILAEAMPSFISSDSSFAQSLSLSLQ